MVIPAGLLLGLCGPGRAVGQTSDPSELEERIAEFEERLDEVEKKTILDRINLTGEYRTILNSYFFRSRPADSPEIDRTTEEVWSHRIRINMRAEPLDSVRVSARLTMFKIFGDADAPPFIPDFEQSRLPRDSAARFDQAWIDWFALDWLAFSAGRIAYQGGPPADLINNSDTRQATWGTHLVDGEYDTVNLTFNLNRLGMNAYVRIFYGSYFFDDDAIPFLDNGTDNLRLIGGDIEFQIPGLGRNFFQLGYLFIPRWTFFPGGIEDPFYDASADFRNAPGALSDRFIFPSATPDSLGSWQNLAALLMFYDFLGSGIDFFISGAVAFLKSSNEGVEYNLPSDLSDPTSPRRSTPFLFLSGTEEEDTQSFFFFAGARYTLPIDALNRPKIGVEFNHGSRYLIALQQTTDRLVSKLETRGNAVEAYAIFPFNKHLFVRLGYLFIDRNFDGVFVGPNPAVFGSTSPEIDETLHNLSLTFNATL